MKKIIVSSYLVATLLAAFQVQAVGRNGAGTNPNAGQGMSLAMADSRVAAGNDLPQDSVQKQFEADRERQASRSNRGSASKPVLGGKKGLPPLPIQTEVLRLSQEFSQAAEFMQEVAQGLAALRSAYPEVFNDFFGDKDSNASMSNSGIELFSNLPTSFNGTISSDKYPKLTSEQRAVLEAKA
jgi:hypothetical protein